MLKEPWDILICSDSSFLRISNESGAIMQREDLSGIEMRRSIG
jgi:hypothetical protein